MKLVTLKISLILTLLFNLSFVFASPIISSDKLHLENAYIMALTSLASYQDEDAHDAIEELKMKFKDFKLVFLESKKKGILDNEFINTDSASMILIKLF